MRTKKYNSIDIDMETQEADVDLVAHLGIKRYRTLIQDSKYINIYNYQ